MADIEGRNNPDEKRYEAWLDGELAGWSEYLLTEELIVFSHTEVVPKFEGRGVGSALARFALEDVRADGSRKVLPMCPFIKGWIERHRDYLDLVDGAPTTSPSTEMPPAQTEFDVVVIGGGPVGENVAQYAADGVLTAAVVEGELMGGECSYYACMPSKALLRPVEVAGVTNDLPGVTAAEVEREALLRRRDEWVSQYDDSGQVDWAEGAGLTVLRGHGALVGERQVEVRGSSGTQRVSARRAVVLATGSVPEVPAAFREALPWGSRDATGVVEVPSRLLIVGGGVVACEAATWMAALGSTVTMLVRGPGLLAGQEPFAGETVAEALRAAGVDVRLSTDVTEMTRPQASDTGLGRIHGGPVTVSTGTGQVLEADEVLVATGRHPRLADVGLAAVGLEPQDVLTGRLPDWLHAVGDASGHAPLTHTGKYEARVLGAALAAQAGADPESPTPEVVPVPQVVFTDPQVATVGLTEAAAREAGHDVLTAQVPWSGAAGSALLRDHPVGAAKLVVDGSSGVVLGATFVGSDAAEVLHSATVAIVGQVPVRVLRHAIPSYPTVSELWLRLLEDLPRELR